MGMLNHYLIFSNIQPFLGGYNVGITNFFLINPFNKYEK